MTGLCLLSLYLRWLGEYLSREGLAIASRDISFLFIVEICVYKRFQK